MTRLHQPSPWERHSKDAYVPLSYQGNVIGFCKPNVADHIVETLNSAERLHKALHMACSDLLAQRGDSPINANTLVQQYLAKAERPKHGTPAIALLLKERQAELDVTDEEFTKFCDTFRLSRVELHHIYAGHEIDSNQLNPLSRILGISVDELIEIWREKE